MASSVFCIPALVSEIAAQKLNSVRPILRFKRWQIT